MLRTIIILFLLSNYALSEELEQPQNNSNNNNQTVYCSTPEIKQSSITETNYKVDTKIQASGQYKKSSNTTGINISNNQNVNFYNCKSDSKEVSNINNTLNTENHTNTINLDISNKLTAVYYKTNAIAKIITEVDNKEKEKEKTCNVWGCKFIKDHLTKDDFDVMLALVTFLALLTWQITDRIEKRSLDFESYTTKEDKGEFALEIIISKKYHRLKLISRDNGTINTIIENAIGHKTAKLLYASVSLGVWYTIYICGNFYESANGFEIILTLLTFLLFSLLILQLCHNSAITYFIMIYNKNHDYYSKVENANDIKKYTFDTNNHNICFLIHIYLILIWYGFLRIVKILTKCLPRKIASDKIDSHSNPFEHKLIAYSYTYVIDLAYKNLTQKQII